MPWKDPEKKRAYDRKYKKQNPSKIRNKWLISKYGITWEDRQKMEDEQGGVCRVCRGKSTGKGILHVDHDHVTGKIRGLLCYNCNLILGYAHDNPDVLRALAEYLEK